MFSVVVEGFVGSVAGIEPRDSVVVLHSIQCFHGNLAARLSCLQHCCMFSVVVVRFVGLVAEVELREVVVGFELREIVGVDGRAVGSSTGSSCSSC